MNISEIALLDLSSTAQTHVRKARRLNEIQVMGSHEHRGSLAVGISKHLDNLLPIREVEVARRFVRKQDARLHHESTSKSHSLLLSSRERTAQASLISRQTNLLQVLVYFLVDHRFRHSPHSQWQRHVLIDRAVKQEHIVLKDHSHLAS
jgi:hypothetical protein